MTLPPDAALRQKLNATHAALLRIHKALVDHERDRYARAQRPVGSPLEFLNLLLHDPRFAWLRPISELIVQLDETASTRTPVDPDQAANLLKQAQTLLTPAESAEGFPHHYHHALQESPEVSAAHAEWKRTIV
ncbi:MAG TPA: hypothetical protein VFE58_02915 [Tepidisphaeraceae bacterium]|jgi:hypothetical protein|nr:hypothetical protein [Tepidisphaeraceae bacterium]